MDKKAILKNVLLFLVIFLGLNLVFKGCSGNNSTDLTSPINQGDIGFMTTKNTYTRKDIVTVDIKNNTKEAIALPITCPDEPLDVLKFNNGNWEKITASPEIDCSNQTEYKLDPGQQTSIQYNYWNNALFGSLGRFKISFILGEKTYTTNEFSVEKEGILSQLWNAVLYRPIYNALLFFSYIVPGHNLGIAIILLTILIRTILLGPSQKAMKAQRRMQEVQPMLESIKEKYKGDQQRIAKETMAIWKTHKVNPMGSCLPLLLQFPILIALFWVIKNGLNPDELHLLYKTYEGFSLKDITTNFAWMDLTKVNTYVLPVIIGLLQFLQMKLAIAKTKKSGQKVKNEMAIANNVMTYMMPVMIAVFTASLPAGVGVYWGVSTLYGIFQQLVVNRSKIAPKPDNDDSVTVKVINS